MLWHRRTKVGPNTEPGETKVEPNETEVAPWPILEGLGTAREQAAALIGALVEAGLAGKAVPIDRLAAVHRKICTERNAVTRGWLAVSRELKRLGLRKTKVWVGADLVTYYIVAELAPPNVVNIHQKAV